MRAGQALATTSTQVPGSYNAVLTAAQAKVELMGIDNAAAAACAQFAAASVGGIRLEHHPLENMNDVYAMVDVCEGWPRLQGVRNRAYLFFRPSSSEYLISNYYDPASQASAARIPCDAGKIPIGHKMWFGSRQARATQTTVMLDTTLATPEDVKAAQAAVESERNEALRGIRAQLRAVTAVILADAPNADLNGRCKTFAQATYCCRHLDLIMLACMIMLACRHATGGSRWMATLRKREGIPPVSPPTCSILALLPSPGTAASGRGYVAGYCVRWAHPYT